MKWNLVPAFSDWPQCVNRFDSTIKQSLCHFAWGRESRSWGKLCWLKMAVRFLTTDKKSPRNREGSAVGVNAEIKVWSTSLAFKYFMSEKAHGATTQLWQMTCVRLGCKHTCERSRATKSTAESFLSPFLFFFPYLLKAPCCCRTWKTVVYFFSSVPLFFQVKIIFPAQCKKPLRGDFSLK